LIEFALSKKSISGISIFVKKTFSEYLAENEKRDNLKERENGLKTLYY
jgi:hypothetical protein